MRHVASFSPQHDAQRRQTPHDTLNKLGVFTHDVRRRVSPRGIRCKRTFRPKLTHRSVWLYRWVLRCRLKVCEVHDTFNDSLAYLHVHLVQKLQSVSLNLTKHVRKGFLIPAVSLCVILFVCLSSSCPFVIVIKITYICSGDQLRWSIPSGSLIALICKYCFLLWSMKYLSISQHH